MELATKLDRPETTISRHHPVGASTGYMEDLRGDWPAQLELACELSPFAIELSALSEPELPGLAAFLGRGQSLPFRYISIHGPSKKLSGNEEDLVNSLIELADYADAIVMHPDTIELPHHFRALGNKLLLENMDARKATGKTPDEMAAMFAELPDAGFCLDIAHAWSIDNQMSVAENLLDHFGDRLRHLHVSSLSRDLHHVPLTAEHEKLFRSTLERCVDVPWIFEAPLAV